jgi:hypothetical protein
MGMVSPYVDRNEACAWNLPTFYCGIPPRASNDSAWFVRDDDKKQTLMTNRRQHRFGDRLLNRPLTLLPGKALARLA